MSRDSQSRPNVLCIITDQQRRDHLGCAGNPIIQTPNIDQLAHSGARFERCYVNNPLCMPSRATLWTGRGIHDHGVRCNGIPLNTRIPTIVTALSEAGYRTYSAGKLHLSPFQTLVGADPASLDLNQWPEAREIWNGGHIDHLPIPYYGLHSAHFIGGHGDLIWGEYRLWLKHHAPKVYEELIAWSALVGKAGWETTILSHIPNELHHSYWVADHVIKFIQEQQFSDMPFFCWCSFPDPHHPYHAPEPFYSMYDSADMPTPARRKGELDDLPPFYRRIQTETLRVEGLTGPVTRFYADTPEIMARTFGMVSNVDYNVGRILRELEALGLRKNTIIVYLSDHGDLMGDHWLQQKGPFHFDGLIRVPFIWSWPGRILPGMVIENIASLLDFAPTILELCGIPIPEGPKPVEPFLPLELPPWPGKSLRPALEGEAAVARESVLISHDEDHLGLRLRTLVTDRYRLTRYAGQSCGEIFDLQEDPQELYNLWNSPAHRSLRDELSTQLLDEVIRHEARLPRRLAAA